ncbi:MAG TPA: NYN domain-containing protein, partial [Candidatus Paceibacterota bacterium]|nr:NYN domain-containing protein [Candidatus Paceibacterota bacterium]
LKFIKTMSGLIIKKGNLDIELALDAYIEKNNYNILVLFSGDSDFEYLLKILKDKYIIIVSTRKHISKELLNVSDEYIDLKKLTDNIRIKESQH